MVVVMMGVEDELRLPAQLFQRRLDGRGFRRVHHGAMLALLHQIGVIVAQAGDDFDLHRVLPIWIGVKPSIDAPQY